LKKERSIMFRNPDREVDWARIVMFVVMMAAWVCLFLGVGALGGCAYQFTRGPETATLQGQLTLGESQLGAGDASVGKDPRYIQQGLNQFWDSPSTQRGMDIGGQIVGSYLGAQIEAKDSEIEALRAEVDRLKALPAAPAETEAPIP
jgi:hypothetical protein